MLNPFIDVVVPAAGVGKRMQLNYPKQYALIGSKTVLEHTVDSLLKAPFVGNIIIGISKGDEYFKDLPLSQNKRIIVGFGGKERSDTVLNCLDKVQSEYVMVHDAARPLISVEDLKALSEYVGHKEVDGAILACKVADTIKKVENGVIVKTVPRDDLYRAYTPQLFNTALLKQSLTKAYQEGKCVTDDASAMELYGYKVAIVEGRSDNFKLTTPDDLKLALNLLKEI